MKNNKNPLRARAPVLIGAGWLVVSAAVGTAATLPTPGEESHYAGYTQHEAVARFLSRVQALAPEARVLVIGRTKDVREYAGRDLYLCVLSEEGVARPDQRNPDKPTVLIVASQHGNEQSAKEAALELIRDVALGDLRPLLKRVNLLVIPQANPYGNFFDRRTNEQDLDLNRDHAKLESEETRAIHRVFRDWMPEVTLDLHEKGDDYYRVSIGCVSNINIDPRIQDFARNRVLADVERTLGASKIAFHEYLVTEEMGINTASGAAIGAEDLKDRPIMMRYSTTDLNDGRNSLGIFETLSFIQECSSRHDLKTLAERTGWQAAGIRAVLRFVAGHGAEVKSLIGDCRKDLAKRAAPGAENVIHLKMDFARDPGQPELVLKRFANAGSTIIGVLKSDKKAGDAVSEEDLAEYPWPSRVKVVTETVKNWFPLVEPRLNIEAPRGYVIPASRAAVVETLLRLGVEVETFVQDASVPEEVYQVADIAPAKYDYLPPVSMVLERKELSSIVHKGDFFVSCDQPAANLIPCLLEPESEFGFIRYQALKLVPEKGGIFAVARWNGGASLPLVPYENFLR
jgi:hypothetical protein